MSDERKNRDQKDQDLNETDAQGGTQTNAQKDQKEESDTMGAQDES